MATQTYNQTATVHYVSVKNSNLLHADRIKLELIEAGISRFGLKKFAVHYLPRIIHANEHIMGAVYGRYGTDVFFSSMNEGMLVATDRRVIFIDHKPGFTDIKELTYEAVSGLERVTTGIFSAVTLYTKLGDFNIHNAKPKCVEKFAEYVEVRRLESEFTSSRR